MAAEVVEIVDALSGASARILVSLGFNCFSWRPVLADGPREMLWADVGFDAGDKRPSGSGIPLLFPFPGRIGGDPEHRGSALGKGLGQAGEVDRLLGAARRVGAWIEKQHQLLAGEIR